MNSCPQADVILKMANKSNGFYGVLTFVAVTAVYMLSIPYIKNKI
jgi:hypothetical protein